tara:strand:+ start:6239 stop:6775 length:537 start_codon:yes stop_codon:yes gene_type:complete
MKKIDLPKLLNRNKICLTGGYFLDRKENTSLIRCLFSSSFIFSLLIQMRTKNNRFISFISGFFLFFLFRSDISNKAEVSEEIFFPHPMGIVIGSRSSLCGKIIVFDNTSFGKKYPGTNDGMPKLTGIGLIGSGSKLLGEISLSGKYVIGANSVLTQSLKNKTYIASKIIDGVYFDNKS